MKALKELKKSYQEKTNTEQISDSEREKRIFTLDQHIKEIQKLDKYVKDPTKISEEMLAADKFMGSNG